MVEIKDKKMVTLPEKGHIGKYIFKTIEISTKRQSMHFDQIEYIFREIGKKV